MLAIILLVLFGHLELFDPGKLTQIPQSVILTLSQQTTQGALNG
jgi:hypothetical protein